MAVKELWNKEIPKPDFKQLQEVDPRVNDWVTARFDLRAAINRTGPVLQHVHDTRNQSETSNWQASDRLDVAKREMLTTIERRKCELVDDPAAIKLYLPAINQAVSKRDNGKKHYIVKIQIEEQDGQDPSFLKIRTLCPDGQDRDCLIKKSLLAEAFPCLKKPGRRADNFVELLREELNKAGGLAIPFNYFGGFHLVAGRLEFTAKHCRDYFLYDLAKEQLEQERHPSVVTLRSCEQASLEAGRIYRTALDRFNALSSTRSMHNDWSRALSLAKASLALNARQGILEVTKISKRYTLAFNSEPVFRLREDELLEGISASRKKDPFVVTPISKSDSRAILQPAKRLSELNPGDFLTSGGKLIVGEPRAMLGDIFQAVVNAMRVFPSDDMSRAVERIRDNSDVARKQQYYTRHWANDFIERFGPDRVLSGAFSTDGQWRVYVFDQLDRVIAEADHYGNATYVGTLRMLPSFVGQSRTHILSAQPDGFLGRVWHQGAQEELNERWKREISAALRS